MNDDYVKRSDVHKAFQPKYAPAINQTFAAMIDSVPASNVVEVVRCKDCKHRRLNEHYGEKGYLRIKAMCELDTGDPFELSRCAEDDDWFCADGERKDGGQNNGTA